MRVCWMTKRDEAEVSDRWARAEIWFPSHKWAPPGRSDSNLAPMPTKVSRLQSCQSPRLARYLRIQVISAPEEAQLYRQSAIVVHR
jgi:hypothetical protein